MARPDTHANPTTGRGPAQRDPADVAQLAAHPVSYRPIARLFAPHAGRLSVVVLLIVASSVIGLATPFLTRSAVDDAIPHQDVPLLLQLVAGLVGVAIATAVLGVVQTWLATRIGQRIMHTLRTDLFAHLQRQDVGFFTRTRSGEVTSRLTNDVAGVQNVVTSSATSAAANLTTVVGSLVAMLALSWRLTLISLLVLPPAIYVSRKVATMRREVSARRQAALASLHGQVEESLSVGGATLAKTLGSGPALAERFTTTSHGILGLEVAAQLAGRWRMATMSIVFAAIPALLYLAAGLPATSAGMTIGTLVAFTALQGALFRPLMGLLDVGVQLTASSALFSRLFEYLDLPVVVADPADPVPFAPETVRGDVTFDDVTFRYPGADRDALHGISLTVPAGSHLALVGATGSGKTTLASLLPRLMDVTSGTVRIDGVDVRDVRLTDLAAVVGVVSQEPYLLHASVAENLRVARPEASAAEARGRRPRGAAARRRRRSSRRVRDDRRRSRPPVLGWGAAAPRARPDPPAQPARARPRRGDRRARHDDGARRPARARPGASRPHDDHDRAPALDRGGRGPHRGRRRRAHPRAGQPHRAARS